MEKNTRINFIYEEDEFLVAKLLEKHFVWMGIERINLEELSEDTSFELSDNNDTNINIILLDSDDYILKHMTNQKVKPTFVEYGNQFGQLLPSKIYYLVLDNFIEPDERLCDVFKTACLKFFEIYQSSLCEKKIFHTNQRVSKNYAKTYIALRFIYEMFALPTSNTRKRMFKEKLMIKMKEYLKNLLYCYLNEFIIDKTLYNQDISLFGSLRNNLDISFNELFRLKIKKKNFTFDLIDTIITKEDLIMMQTEFIQKYESDIVYELAVVFEDTFEDLFEHQHDFMNWGTYLIELLDLDEVNVETFLESCNKRTF